MSQSPRLLQRPLALRSRSRSARRLASDTFYVKLEASSGASLGTYAGGVEANGTGGKYANGTFSMVISTTSTPSLSVTCPTSTLSIARGSVGTLVATLIRNGGYTGTVTPALSGLSPQLVYVGGTPILSIPTSSFSDTSMTGADATTTLSVTIPSNFPLGTTPTFVQMAGSGVATAGFLVYITVT